MSKLFYPGDAAPLKSDIPHLPPPDTPQGHAKNFASKPPPVPGFPGAFRPGDTVKVHVNIVEGNRTRVQVFQGVVIARQGHGVRETFTVRKISFQVGVERTFPVHSPVIDHIEVVTRGDVRRAKLYYLRGLRGKKAKIREKRDA